MIGYFTDDKRSRYFMVTNQSWHQTQTITIMFNFTKMNGNAVAVGLLQMDKQTGAQHHLDIECSAFEHARDQTYRFRLTLPPGDGELFMYDDGTPMQTSPLAKE